ncbi:MAG: glycosyltransferase family 1 protein [bacterium]
MKIGIDIRSLMDRQYSGVNMYAFNLLNALFKIDKKNEYVLFYNGFNRTNRTYKTYWTDKDNVKLCGSRIPNKIFNASVTFLNWPKIDKMMGKTPPFGCRSGQALTPLWKRGKQTRPLCERGKQKVDIFFIPNFLFSAFSKDCKKIITVHDLSFERCPQFYSLRGRLWHKFVRTGKMCMEADLIIAVSENTKYDIMELYRINEDKIKVIYPGCNIENQKTTSCEAALENTNAMRGSGLSSNEIIAHNKNLPRLSEKYILFLGNVEKRKNVSGVIEAFKILNEAHGICDYDLVIAGKQKLRNKEIEKLAIESKIKLLGYINESEKSKLYRDASLFVYPSFYEGFGFPPLEAMRHGVPVIASHTSSLPEVVGDAALMVDPYNVENIASAMKQMLTDEKLCSLMIARGYEQVKKFNWEKCAREMMQIFREIN